MSHHSSRAKIEHPSRAKIQTTDELNPAAARSMLAVGERMAQWTGQRRRSQAGNAQTEYLLLAALIALVVIAVVIHL
jgi:hypothetical protein